MRLLAAILAAIAMTGCASTEYAAYAAAHRAQAEAQTERYRALAKIAESGDTTAKVAAVLSLNAAGGASQQAQIATPRTWADYALQWTGLLLPTVTQVYAVNKQTSLGMRQSDNATALGISTNEAFVGIASKIQAPTPNVTTTTTLNGHGVIGAGAYSIGPNSGANSGNTGKLAGTTLTDQTSAPTIVRPEVVTNTNTTTTTNTSTSSTTTQAGGTTVGP